MVDCSTPYASWLEILEGRASDYIHTPLMNDIRGKPPSPGNITSLLLYEPTRIFDLTNRDLECHESSSKLLKSVAWVFQQLTFCGQARGTLHNQGFHPRVQVGGGSWVQNRKTRSIEVKLYNICLFLMVIKCNGHEDWVCLFWFCRSGTGI
jgi:hypothetical protein